MSRAAILRPPAPGSVLGFAGTRVTVLASAPHGILDYFAPAGFAGVAPHRHAVATEWFRVLEGGLEFRLGDVVHRAEPGGFAQVPPGLVHLWRAASAEMLARFLLGFDRPRMDGFFAEMAGYAAAQTV